MAGKGFQNNTDNEHGYLKPPKKEFNTIKEIVKNRGGYTEFSFWIRLEHKYVITQVNPNKDWVRCKLECDPRSIYDAKKETNEKVRIIPVESVDRACYMTVIMTREEFVNKFNSREIFTWYRIDKIYHLRKFKKKNNVVVSSISSTVVVRRGSVVGRNEIIDFDPEAVLGKKEVSEIDSESYYLDKGLNFSDDVTAEDCFLEEVKE